MKEKAIQKYLLAIVIAAIIAALIPLSCKAQNLYPTLYGVKLDTVAARNDTIWLSDQSGNSAYIMIKNDSLVFGDNSGEKYLANLATGGTPGGSLGDIQYNNSGNFDGAPMSTDGTDIVVDGAIDVNGGTYIDEDGITLKGGTVIKNVNKTNIAIGQNTFNNSSTSANNIAIGHNSQKNNISGGHQNVSVGLGALEFNTTGYLNTSIGSNSLNSNTTGGRNVAVGYALFNNIDGGYNVGVGHQSLLGNTSGDYNTGIGMNALTRNTTGDRNISIGATAGSYNTTLSNRLFINSLIRSTIEEDSTLSIIYGHQNTSTENQELYLNSNVNVKHNLYAPYASFTDSVYSQKGKFDTVNIAGAEITHTINLQTAVESIEFNTLTTKILDVNRVMRDTTYHAIGGFEDSTVTVNIPVINTWYHVTNATNDLVIGIDAQGFAISGDTLISLTTGDFRGMVSITFSGTTGNEYQFRAYNVTQGRQISFKQGITANGTSVYRNICFPLYERLTAGDRVVFQVENITAANPAIMRHYQFEAVYLHD